MTPPGKDDVMATSPVDAGTARTTTPDWTWLGAICLGGRDPFVPAVVAESAGLNRSRYQPERLGCEDLQRTCPPQDDAVGGRMPLRRVHGRVPIYLWKLYDHVLNTDADGAGALGTLLLVRGALFVALHAVSDIGIYGVLDGKLASFGAQHDHSVSYTLYLLTYALDSVADVFGSLFVFATGVLVFRSGVLPRWLGWVSMLAAPPALSPAFGLGGVIASFGLILDLIGFVLLLLFVLVSSVILLGRAKAPLGDCQRSDFQLGDS